MKIGLLGGSFDPVHLGHLAAAADARAACALDRVVFVPAAQAPLKPVAVRASAPDRLAMLRAAVADDQGFDVSDFELQRGGVSYTIDTARHFHAQRPDDELFWVIGIDQLAQLPRWREIGELARLLSFIVLERPGHAAVAPDPVIPGLRLVRVPGRCLDISSTELRARLGRGEPVDAWVPHKTVVYLREKRLYH